MYNKTKIAVVVIGVALFLLAINSYTTVSTQHVKVPDFMGKVVDGKVYDDGIHIVNPMYNMVSFDLRQKTLEFNDETMASQDKLNSTIDIVIMYNIERSAVVNIRKDYSTLRGLINMKFTPYARSVFRDVAKSINRSQDYYTEETQRYLISSIKSQLIEKLQPLGINISDVTIADITLPRLITSAIEETKKREEKVLQQRQQLEIQKLEAQKATAVAQGQLDATRLSAEGVVVKARAEAKRIKVLSLAEADKIKRITTAEAEGYRKVKTQLNPTLVDLETARRWNGKLPTTMMSSGGIPLLNIK